MSSPRTQVDIEALADLAARLLFLADQLEGAGAQASTAARLAAADEPVAAAVDRVQAQWSIRRGQIVDYLRSLGINAAESAQAYRRYDQQLAQQAQVLNRLLDPGGGP